MYRIDPSRFNTYISIGIVTTIYDLSAEFSELWFYFIFFSEWILPI